MTSTHVPSRISSHSSSPPLSTPLLFATAKRAVHPYLCVICRVLLICAFIDNASQTLLDYTHHVVYLTSTYHIPSVVALLLIAASSMTSFLACTMVFLKPLRRRGIHLLLLCLVYQHVVYGFMSSPSSASPTSFAFNNNNVNLPKYARQHDSYQYSSSSDVVPTSTASFMRTVCLVLTLLLLRTQTKPDDGDRWNRKNATLLTTVVNREEQDRKTFLQRQQQQQQQQQESRLFRAMWNVDVIALLSRAMFAVLACQMASLSGVTSMWIVAPMAAAYLFGFMTDVISVLLIAFYVLATFSTHKFWLVDPSANAYAAFERHALRFEFTHNVSIVSGLVVLFTMGPGALSFDKRFTRQQIRVNNTPSQLNSHNVNNIPPQFNLYIS